MTRPEERLAQIDGVLGSAGHELEDPRHRELLEQRLAGVITAEEYRRAVLAS